MIFRRSEVLNMELYGRDFKTMIFLFVLDKVSHTEITCNRMESKFVNEAPCKRQRLTTGLKGRKSLIGDIRED